MKEEQLVSNPVHFLSASHHGAHASLQDQQINSTDHATQHKASKNETAKSPNMK